MKVIFLSWFLILSMASYTQEKLVKDLDGDKIMDTVFLHTDNSKIVSRLSTTKFQEVKSMEIELLGDQNGVRATKNGFELWSSFMRAGNSCQFRFDTSAKKIRLIGISVYEFGNAANDGSGEGSVNLLTNTYIGDWSSYDQVKEKLVKLPRIKKTMKLGKIYLEDFTGKIIDDFLGRSSSLYQKQRDLYVK